jgi:hypothetical protein
MKQDGSEKRASAMAKRTKHERGKKDAKSVRFEAYEKVCQGKQDTDEQIPPT